MFLRNTIRKMTKLFNVNTIIIAQKGYFGAVRKGVENIWKTVSPYSQALWTSNAEKEKKMFTLLRAHHFSRNDVSSQISVPKAHPAGSDSTWSTWSRATNNSIKTSVTCTLERIHGEATRNFCLWLHPRLFMDARKKRRSRNEYATRGIEGRFVRNSRKTTESYRDNETTRTAKRLAIECWKIVEQSLLGGTVVTRALRLADARPPRGPASGAGQSARSLPFHAVRPRVHPRRVARGSKLAAVTQSVSHSVGPRCAMRWDLWTNETRVFIYTRCCGANLAWNKWIVRHRAQFTLTPISHHLAKESTRSPLH